MKIKSLGGLIEYEGYYARIDLEDGSILIKLLGIQDSVSTTVSSIAKIENGFKYLVHDYISTCREINKVPEKPSQSKVYSELMHVAIEKANKLKITEN